jgi:hypothetical protein
VLARIPVGVREDLDRKVTGVFVNFCSWYFELKRKEHDDTSLTTLRVAGQSLLKSLVVFEEAIGDLSEVRTRAATCWNVCETRQHVFFRKRTSSSTTSCTTSSRLSGSAA